MTRGALPPSTRRLAAPALVAALTVLLGCGEKKTGPAPGGGEATAREPVTGLTAAESAEVLARVGDRTITLGDYALSLARMDRLERLRYQSKERQKELLDELLEVELLAQEARRRGLDREPEVQQRIDQALRDELLEELRRGLPKPEELPERDVREYYDAHRDEFREPLRHRVLVLVVGDPAIAERVAQEAQGASGEKWAELARKYSLDRAGLEPGGAPELAGDRGFVSAPGEPRGDNPDVPPPVRAAAFTLRAVGDVTDKPVLHERKHYIVRLASISAARDRSLRDAERAIRAELLRQRFRAAEAALEQELRRRYPVTLDAEALRERAARPEAPPSAPAERAPAPAAPPSRPAEGAPAESAPQPSAP